ncbi:hypothetical protein BV504_18500 [Halomonas sp. 'Soap Lake |nr:hypothetical protein B2G49_18655 [Halomonas sp. 'Soap Lake \
MLKPNSSCFSSECLRISRDMHDGLGHHLAALNLHRDPAPAGQWAKQPRSVASPGYCRGNGEESGFKHSF